eukprot:TRINITY_DN6269_c0_g1_i2.p1 TRINITY_DN6269_c0_g1~~TRINITY_DN6269_c0_g1_i2.p1  ORF type:complete len:186 (-),score=39.90 TRINITY_DN6269_c0_g1_i2:237-794(-)
MGLCHQPKKGMNYIISGAGGAVARTRSNEVPDGSLMHYEPDGGFVGLQICNKTSAVVTIYGQGGEVQQTWPVTNAEPDRLIMPQAPVQWDTTDPPVQASSCGSVWLKSVEKYCATDGCKVMPDQMSNQSCADYCSAGGLQCSKAWLQQEDVKDCTIGPSLSCQEGVKASENLICECTPPKSTLFP